jgi:hypothetical protein
LSIGINAASGSVYKPATDTLANFTTTSVTGKIALSLPLIVDLLSAGTSASTTTFTVATNAGKLGDYFAEKAGATVTRSVLNISAPNLVDTYADLGGDTTILGILKDTQNFKDSLQFGLDAIGLQLADSIPTDVPILGDTALEAANWFTQLTSQLMDKLKAGIGVAAPVAGVLYPPAGLALGLVSSLLEVFQPLAREKLTKELSKHTSNPEVAAQVTTVPPRFTANTEAPMVDRPGCSKTMSTSSPSLLSLASPNSKPPSSPAAPAGGPTVVSLIVVCSGISPIALSSRASLSILSSSSL